ncbi:hypothetical protein sos41_11760 [Alphaproteobacteria bacterium SO-S41]|nr:hypothetical protein sos41_11760 [Alphaproteobacteria bacterium SO-S41]
MQQAVAMAVASRDQLIGVREMAALTKVAASTVTRYVQRHPELGVTVSGQTKVWRDAYLAHRADNPDIEDPDVTSPAPPLAGGDMPPLMKVEQLPGRAAKNRHEEARAELVELELAERKGSLVPAAEVQAALAETMQKLRDRLIGVDMEFAERVMAAGSPREAALMMSDRGREALMAIVAELKLEP